MEPPPPPLPKRRRGMKGKRKIVAGAAVTVRNHLPIHPPGTITTAVAITSITYLRVTGLTPAEETTEIR